jgi:hypothetical protein
MLLREVMDIMEIVDSRYASGEKIKEFFKQYDQEVSVEKVEGEKGYTDFVKIFIEGDPKVENKKTLGIIGRLGGLGARDARIGLVSDGDGAIAALSAGLKIVKMKKNGDLLPCNVIISTHVCPDAPTLPHKPVDFMDSPVDMTIMNEHEVNKEMDAIISIDTTKGNNIINHKGISISPTVKEGYILRVSPSIVGIMEIATGLPANVFALSIQDITPYGNDLYHINSILQPATATSAPVLGVAITAESAVPGCGTGASHEIDIAQAANFSIEIAKEFKEDGVEFYDEEEFDRLIKLYGDNKIFQTKGKEN